MCGRYNLTRPVDALRDLFACDGPPPNLPPRYNIAPTQDVAVVRAREGGGRELALMRWGLIPSWSKGPDPKFSMINARAETVTGKPAFRAAFRDRRCLLPADGFYEWRSQSGRKQPYLIRPPDHATMAFAGLWERWQGLAGEDITSVTIIVTGANERLSAFHDRMPVIVVPADFALWLEGGRAMAPAAEGLLRPLSADRLQVVAVSTRVNSSKNDDPACLEPLAP
ncbi:MAG: SOS response-associated peptidase [Alphaproteobacteria bacterium]|nr:SOS response-associated peptidase [Alphaproteobacteria bacterium]